MKEPKIFKPISQKIEAIGKAVVHSAYKVHSSLGPGLLEKVYEICMAYELELMGYSVERQRTIPIIYKEMTFEEGLRLDILIDNQVIIEIKALDHLNPVWFAQVLSHLKLSDLSLGFLINFNVPIIKQGITRIRNG